MLSLLWALLVGTARAHSGSVPIRGQYDWSNLPQAEPGVWVVWEMHWSIVLGCAAFVGVYAWMAGPGRRKYGWSDEGPTPGQWARFLLAIAIVFCALQGPLHELSDKYLFSAHMVQHLLITLFFPPLVLRGIPAWMWKPVVAAPWRAAFGRAITQPMAAVLIATTSLYMWHVPSMYDWALVDHNVHIVEHLIFMTGAVVMWWPVHSPISEVPALTPGWRMIYLFVLTIPMKALGAILTVSDYVLYQFYATQPRVFGLDPLVDQRTGGLIMWLPGGLVFWFTIGWIFFTHYYAEAAAQRSGARPEPVAAK
jgi:putative membrane protein